MALETAANAAERKSKVRIFCLSLGEVYNYNLIGDAGYLNALQ